MKERVVHFPDPSLTPDIHDIGEKGLSLFDLAQAGLSVPRGFILTVEFFRPWIDLVEASPEWQKFISLSPEKMWGYDSLSEMLPDLILTSEQKASLDEALGTLQEFPLVALRPSLADPIILGSSFADHYETHLAIKHDQVPTLLSRIFCSCIDARIYMIQKKRGLETPRIRIAIIVQTQITSESSGVALSVNPSTNDYDHAYIKSVWGLGDNLADGAVEPDHFTVDKISRQILTSNLGSKRITNWLNFQNVVERRPDWKHNQLSLSKGQVAAVTEALVKAEIFYSSTVKLEWTFSGGELQLLQASPLDPEIPLSSKLQTRTDDPRRLYLNLTATYFGLRRPLSITSSDLYSKLIEGFMGRLLGKDSLAEHWKQLLTCWKGSIYLDVSLLLSYFPKKIVVAFVSKFDPASAQALSQLDTSSLYRPEQPHGLLATLIRIAVRNPSLPVKIVCAFLFPGLGLSRMKRGIKKAHIKLTDRAFEKLPLDEAVQKLSQVFARAGVSTFLPSFAASFLAQSYLRVTFGNFAQNHWRMKECLRSMGLYHPHIYTRVLPLELHYLSRLVRIENIGSESDLIRRLHQDDVPPSFKQAWLRLLERFGKKGFGAADLSAPRFAEETHLLLPSIFHLLKKNVGAEVPTPQMIFEKTERNRSVTRQAFLDRAAVQFWPEIFLVNRATQVTNSFSCATEFFQEEFIDAIAPIRQRLLETATEFSTHNRLDQRDQIFNLSFSQIDHASLHSQIDLREIIGQSEIISTRMAKLIDSRGKIYTESSRDSLNENIRFGMVPGKVRARAHYLDSYRPQDFEPGEILVVSSLDSSWSPIISMASAIIVESGGEWCPGIRTAIEHNIPCISGVSNLTEKIRSGDLIEVDGEKGIFKKLQSSNI